MSCSLGFQAIFPKRWWNENHKGFMSAIIDADTHQILGAYVLGVGGDEIISGFLNLMYAGAGYEVIRDSEQVHPTVSELIPTMLENLQPVEEKVEN